jgi:hypothetical protein
MNLNQLKRDVGYRVRLVPSACYVDETGEPTFVQDGDWTITAVNVNEGYVDITGYAGQTFRLGTDHIRSLATDHSDPEIKRGFLQLLVQLFVYGDKVTAVPNDRPGAAILPPVNAALKARTMFVPDIARLMRRLVYILDRAIVNASITADSVFGGPPSAITTGDTWKTLQIADSQPMFSEAAYGDLLTSDAQVLSEFYGGVTQVSELLKELMESTPLTDYNSWNVVMHKAEHAIRLGIVVVQKFCPERIYDATMPAVGTLLARAEKTLEHAKSTRTGIMTKLEARRAQANSNPKPQRR